MWLMVARLVSCSNSSSSVTAVSSLTVSYRWHSASWASCCDTSVRRSHFWRSSMMVGSSWMSYCRMLDRRPLSATMKVCSAVMSSFSAACLHRRDKIVDALVWRMFHLPQFGYPLPGVGRGGWGLAYRCFSASLRSVKLWRMSCGGCHTPLRRRPSTGVARRIALFLGPTCETILVLPTCE